MNLPENAFAPSTNCPHLTLESGSFVNWEDENLQWPHGLGPPAADGSSITLPSDTTILISSGSLISTSTTVTILFY